MAEVLRNKHVKSGSWRALESGWNVSFACRFRDPAGAQVKVRYGNGWPIGWNSQKRTLDGTNTTVNVSKVSSRAFARVQMKVKEDTEATYTYIPTGP